MNLNPNVLIISLYQSRIYINIFLKLCDTLQVMGLVSRRDDTLLSTIKSIDSFFNSK